MEWNLDMGAAPKDRDILVWYDHDAAPYLDPDDPNRLTDYAALCEVWDFLAGSGVTVAKWHGREFESQDEYGSGYWHPAGWFSRGDYCHYESVCNPVAWAPIVGPSR